MTNLLARITAIERRENLSSTSNTPPREERIEAVERAVKDLEEALNDLVENCRGSVEAMKDEMLEMNTKLNLTMRAVGSQPATGPIGMEYGRVKVPEPRPYGGARDAKDLENFLFDMEHYF